MRTKISAKAAEMLMASWYMEHATSSWKYLSERLMNKKDFRLSMNELKLIYDHEERSWYLDNPNILP